MATLFVQMVKNFHFNSKTMKCPKCGDSTRKKMTGAVCLNDDCDWYTHDVSTVKPKLLFEDGKGNIDMEHFDPYDDPSIDINLEW